MENQREGNDIQNIQNLNDSGIIVKKKPLRWIRLLIIVIILLLGSISIYCGYFLFLQNKETKFQNLNQKIKIAEIIDKAFLSMFYTYSPDGKKVAYTERTRIGEQWSDSVYLNDKKMGKYDSSFYFFFSPDSKRFAYVAELDKQEFVVLDGQTGKKYTQISNLITPIFSPDSKNFAYVVDTDMAIHKGKHFLVLNGKESKEYDDIRDFTFSKDSKNSAYIAGNAGKDFVVINGKEGKYYDSIGQGYLTNNSNLLFTTDNNIIYLASENGKNFLVVNDKEGEKYEDIWKIAVSSDGKSVAFFAKEGDKGYLILNGKKIDTFDLYNFFPRAMRPEETSDFYNFDFLQFGPDNQKLAYVASEHGAQFVVVNGEKGKKYDNIGSLQFSPDGDTIVYMAWQAVENKMFAVINGKATEYDNFQGYFRGGFVFSPDGKNVAYVAEK